MSDTRNGGPAFPAYASDHRGAACNTTFEPKGGMTLRDYFAAKAMQGLAANPEAWDMTDERVAEWAYNAADAMLKAREEE